MSLLSARAACAQWPLAFWEAGWLAGWLGLRSLISPFPDGDSMKCVNGGAEASETHTVVTTSLTRALDFICVEVSSSAKNGKGTSIDHRAYQRFYLFVLVRFA